MPPLNLKDLNPPQRAAVEHIEGPSLVLAGAGSGKTRVLTSKIAYLVSQGVKPWRILAVTFTNKAAREMASRVEKLLDMPTRDLWIGTFHSICVRILRREAPNWGFDRDFTIYDDDRTRVIRKALAELGIPSDRLSPGKVKHVIGKAKNDFIAPDAFGEMVSGPDSKLLVKVYERYGQKLREANAFDFDDLLVRPVEMFARYPESLEIWRGRFDHILVDEYQDTNRPQYLFLKHLSAGKGNITVVGDDDQSIYRWRGADIRNILEFEQDYKKVKTVRLEQNYRSTGTILAAANQVIRNNKGRMAKTLWTDRGDGDKIPVFECRDDIDEAERVVSAIRNEREGNGASLRDMVILYRTNAQSRSFEDVLRRQAIPYTIVGGLRFYERKEIKDILAWLRFLANPGDEVSFVRAASAPPRGIGEKTFAAVGEFARGKQITLFDAINRAEEFLPGAMTKRVEKFAGLMRSFRDLRGTIPIGELCRRVVAAIDYRGYLTATDPEAFDDRMANVDELAAAMDEFENLTEDDDLSVFLAEVSLLTDVDSWNPEGEVLTLMTLHAAKGLEFKQVFMVGVELGLFPLPRSFDEPDELEEERRLFYVGATRAMDRLHLSYALSRFRQGSYSGGASMFISEIPFQYLEIDVPPERTPAELYESLREAGSWRRKAPKKRFHASFEDYSQEAPEMNPFAHLREGAFVRHPTFGRGQITAVSGTGDHTLLTIRFTGGERKIMAKFGRLLPG